MSLREIVDETVVANAKAGDEQAWNGLYRQTHARVTWMAYYWLRDFQKAEDTAQEVFWRVHREFSAYRPGTNFTAWLFFLTRYTLMDQRKKPESKLVEHSLDEVDSYSHPKIDHVAYYAGFEDAVVTKQLLANALGNLTPDFRNPLLLQMEGFSYQEIAGQLGIPAGTVKSRINRGLDKIRQDPMVQQLKSG
ncbi:RNA polymerase sigma factor [Candidatus Daviesbacteria bacterium]|nr:RNA polymerase sigma factor [Candidatus Daviesbacteria bacterium]